MENAFEIFEKRKQELAKEKKIKRREEVANLVLHLPLDECSDEIKILFIDEILLVSKEARKEEEVASRIFSTLLPKFEINREYVSKFILDDLWDNLGKIKEGYDISYLLKKLKLQVQNNKIEDELIWLLYLLSA